MSVFSGTDGEFILNNAVASVLCELTKGNISKRKVYVIAKGAPNNQAVQNLALVKSKNMSTGELKWFVKILLNEFTKEQEG